MITAQQERDFYDTQYAQFLALPGHALRMDRGVLLGGIENPSHPFYERRLLYRASMKALEAESLHGKKVLDYGCGPADFGLWMATEGADVTLLDLSPAAIELGLKRAHASGVTVRGVAADASVLTMFHDGEFDLVFACAALHHTLKYPGALEELARVMKPGARLVLCETWGGNPLLGLARQAMALITHEEEEQGEDIIFTNAVVRQCAPYFTQLHVAPLNLLGMGKRLLRGRFESSWARAVLRALERADALILSLAPFLRNWCGEAVITGRRTGLLNS